jgi:hypothetical protein
MRTDVQFTTALAYAKDRLRIAGSPDDYEPYTPYTIWYTHFADDKEEPWVHFITKWWAVTVTKYAPTNRDWALVGMSEEGNLHYTFDDSEVEEKIPGSGVFSEGAEGWGYMSGLKQIGEHLYACGGAGQVYKRIGQNSWVHMDKGLLQDPGVSERLLLSAIDGSHEGAIYTAGSLSAMGHPPKVFFWNGLVWRELQLPAVAERINAIHVESETRIWLCGANGTLLLGNANDGFKSLSTVHDNQLFYSICKFEGLMYMGSNMGLFCYDPNNHAKGIREVVTGLSPELQDANVVDAVDGVMWSIGEKDIARFDGKKWERIHHPDNPPIGG